MLNSLVIISTALISLSSLFLGIFSVYRNNKSSSSWLWFFLSIAIFLWSGGLFLNLTSGDYNKALFYSKVLHVGAVFVPVLFYHFILSFLFIKKEKLKSVVLVFGYMLSLTLSYCLLKTDLIVYGVSYKVGFNFWVSAGQFYWALLLHFWLFVFFSLALMLKVIVRQDGVIRRKAFFVFFASFFAFLTGGTNFLPQTIGVYPFGVFVAWLYPLIIIYGVFIDEFKFKIKF